MNTPTALAIITASLRRNTRWLLLLATSICLPALAEIKPLVVIHTNDFHGHISEENEYAGAARIAALVTETRRQNSNVLVVDAGDAISGTPVSTMFQGKPIFSVLNRIGYDAAALGNHEFDHGYAQIQAFREIASYPLLSANALDPAGNYIADAPDTILDINGIRVGLIGLITDTTPDIIIPHGNEDIQFLDPETVLRERVALLRPKVDLLVVLSHVGHEEELKLAAKVAGIDIIVGGHSHTRVEPPVRVNRTWVVQAHCYGSHVGYLELEIDTDKHAMASFNGYLIPAADLPAPQADVAALVAEWEQQVEEAVDFQISVAERDYSRNELQVLFEAIMAEETGADFGFYNSGGIRDTLRAGPVTARHIWNIEPFSNNLVTVTADGRLIRRMVTMEG
ncbi:MAG: bifunctional metallophosphatase/5'-nucleotidase, partial [Pseudomonadales bacterium]|nr:bifunctional metallophosphatase/5'-nucleotidase [Pseudomonadales bacterium]